MESNIGNIVSDAQFWKAVSVLIKNFHVINKTVFAVKPIKCYQIFDKIIEHNKLLSVANEINEKNSDEIFLKHGFQVGVFPQQKVSDLFRTGFQSDFKLILLSIVFFKKLQKENLYILQLIDFPRKELRNIVSTLSAANKLSFSITLSSKTIIATPLLNCIDYEVVENWCQYVLQPKLLSWATNSNSNNNKLIGSLKLIDVGEYNCLYKSLKEKYGKAIVEIWPETTDPLKFVYEDLGIATYLILLWKLEGNYPKEFVDLGCGNGLLVHILNSEGFNGYGIDVRKRKIWDLYPRTTKLKENTIIPNDFSVFKNADWIIGNHSDELSVWIPVIASMCSYNAKYFLLPCCAYEFSGAKYQRKNCQISLYKDFLNYIDVISKKCGFITLVDRLKISSTKRIAYIGTKRAYSENNYFQNCNLILEFVKSQQNKNGLKDIKLRERDQIVRNCTKIDKKVINRIVLDVFNYIIGINGKKNEVSGEWRTGSQVSIKDLVQVVSSVNLKNLKSECGGFKTLLKNKHEIFEVLGNFVKLRKPKKLVENTNKNYKSKKRDCFFFQHHPDGCPLTDNDCSFLH